MNRYQDISIITVDNKKCYQTTRYPEVPLSDQDIYVYVTQGDRFDTLASQFYGDQSLWWIIATANNIHNVSFSVPDGTTLRLPKNYIDILNKT
jgi:hypothetical protein